MGGRIGFKRVYSLIDWSKKRVLTVRFDFVLGLFSFENCTNLGSLMSLKRIPSVDLANAMRNANVAISKFSWP